METRKQGRFTRSRLTLEVHDLRIAHLCCSESLSKDGEFVLSPNESSCGHGSTPGTWQAEAICPSLVLRGMGTRIRDDFAKLGRGEGPERRRRYVTRSVPPIDATQALPLPGLAYISVGYARRQITGHFCGRAAGIP